MGITPSQPVAAAAEDSPAIASPALPQKLLDDLWQQCGAAAWQLSRGDFESLVSQLGEERNYGQSAEATASHKQQAEFFASLRLSEILLARACAAGHEDAWRYFLDQYRQPVLRAAIAITHSESLGRDLAENLYAELYGMNLRDGARRSPLASYQGRGSLLGWLRTILAQRFIDHHRRTGREQPLEDGENSFDPPAPEPASTPAAAELNQLGKAVQASLAACPAEDRFILASYYLDQRTLLEIARLLRVHEATISRKLRRITDALRKAVLHHLQLQGLSKRAAQESLGADPRDLELNLRKLLQSSQSNSFPEKDDA